MKKILTHTFYYEGGIEICARAGNVIGLHCKPVDLLTDASAYESTEIVCSILTTRGTTQFQAIGYLGAILNNAQIDDNFTYKRSFDNEYVIANANDDTLIKIAECMGTRKLLREQSGSIEFPDEPVVLPPPKQKASCRGCGDFDPYDYIEPDNILDDNKYSCWGCVHHPHRWHKDLETEEQTTAFRIYYKLSIP